MIFRLVENAGKKKQWFGLKLAHGVREVTEQKVQETCSMSTGVRVSAKSERGESGSRTYSGHMAGMQLRLLRASRSSGNTTCKQWQALRCRSKGQVCTSHAAGPASVLFPGGVACASLSMWRRIADSGLPMAGIRQDTKVAW